jgi:hypothetical protein
MDTAGDHSYYGPRRARKGRIHNRSQNGANGQIRQGNNSGGSPLRETTTNLWALENITRFIAHLGDRIDPRVLALRDRAQEILAMPIPEGSDGDPCGIPFQRLGDPATYSEGGAFAGGFNESEAANFKLAVLAAADLGKKSAEVLKEVYPAHGVYKMRQPNEG